MRGVLYGMPKLTKEQITLAVKNGDFIKVTGSRRNLKTHEYYEHIADLLELDEVQALKEFRHHIMTTRYQHSLNVSYYNYRLCRMLGLDAASAARAGLLHDLYFYETRHYTRRKPGIRHARYHPMVALEHAQELLPLNEREQDMIEKHMWPVTLSRPRYAETYVITLVDKYCAVIEFLLPQPGRLVQWVVRRRDARKIRKYE